MVDTKKYRTKTEFTARNNGKLPGKWTSALDVGYSGVKLFSPVGIGRFPSYAKKSRDVSFIEAPKDAIVYRDNINDELWLVGAVAQNTIEGNGTTESETALYGRDRYFSPMFRVYTEAGLGISLLNDSMSKIARLDNEPIFVQSGLPEKYMDDEGYIKDVISGWHKFSLSIGGRAWIDFDFEVKRENISIISQPKGTLFSVCIKNNGDWHENARKYLSSDIIVVDPGFGTLDVFPISNGVVGYGETFDNLGMKRVLQETCIALNDKYNSKVTVPAMQKWLEVGTVPSFDRRTLSSSTHPFADILEKESYKVCDEALNTLADAVPLSSYEYMIITGGTGAAWLPRIEEKFKNLNTLTILHGNQNDGLPFVYSNVRGYYYYLYNTVGRKN